MRETTRERTAALALFLLLALAYFAEALAGGLLPNHFDIYGYFYPMMSVVREQYLGGSLPLWNSYMFSGFPLLASSQHSVLYPPTVALTVLFPPDIALMLDLILHYALGGFFAYLYARKLGLGVFPAFCAGLLFSFMGYLVVHMGHVSIVRTGIWLSLILSFYEDIRERGAARSVVLASFAIALQVFAGHPQIYFDSWAVLFLYVLYHAICQPEGRKRFLLAGAGAFFMGMAIASPQIFATYELATQGVRSSLSYESFSSFSFPAENIPALIFPTLHPGRVEGYMGVLPAVLALVAGALGFRANKHARFWSIMAVVSLALALGDALGPLNRLMYRVPVYNSFRGVSKHMLEYGLALSVLCSLAIWEVQKGAGARRYLSSAAVLLALATAASLVVPAVTGMPAWAGPSGMALSALGLFSLLAIVAILKLKRYEYFKYLVILAIGLEVLLFRQADWIRTKKVAEHQEALFSRLAGGADRAAVFAEDVMVPLAMRRGVNLIGGYDPLIPQSYDRLLEMNGVGGRPELWLKLVENNRILSMLSARQVVLPPGTAVPSAEYRKVSESDGYAIYENLRSLPRAHGVVELIGMDGIGEIKAALLNLELDPGTQAALSAGDLSRIGKHEFGRGQVRLIDYGHGRATVRADFKEAGFVVLSEQFHPGWRAAVDGKRTGIFGVNGVLQGVVVPPGSHEISFRYRPYGIYALMALSALLSAAGLALVLRRR